MQAYPVVGKKKSADLCNAFLQGADRSKNAAVFYGVNETNLDAWRRVKAEGRDFYYLDNSYVDAVRGQQFRVTKNALQFKPHEDGFSGGARWRKLGIQLQPWRETGDYVLVCPQSEPFMHDLAGYKGDWLQDTLATFRSCPAKVRAWDRDKARAGTTLQQDLAHAYLLATHASAAAVEAVIAGVKPWCHPDCVVHAVNEENRLTYLEQLADNQFTVEELKDGTAWTILNP